MFEYLEPEASNNQETNSLPLPPRSGAINKGINPEKVRHMLFGSLAGIDRTIKILHALGYADPNDWSDPIPAPPSVDRATAAGSSSGVETWMVILTRTVLIE
ncbi:hypothetical protein IQ265_08175 [Nodosilinea sp. LEGE 06152]|uniref:hypothetical protein n=1 Tax=Nodosilinea sp. LEGE 06152 TaxID=2777966 RepID=UPI00187E7E76|nr:hypothetical protein [Nodosilinea sp. LEGE 06152]MBE9156805.1 hypothetical protein [Nodosilinea sp. LEGE 06152]